MHKSKIITSILNLVDLAGSERLQQDGEIKLEGNEETGFINKSLFILSNVISKLAEGKKGYFCIKKNVYSI